MSTFVQLAKEDCQFLLSLIEEMDSDTAYTARQRAYTVPKLQRIAQDPRSARLAYQDVDYLLELLEDAEIPEQPEQELQMCRESLLQIQNLQSQRFDEMQNREQQRQLRRARRQPAKELQEHFQHTA